MAHADVAAGTRFMVELRDKLEATKVKRGKKFEARALENVRAQDGTVIKSGTKLRGRVAAASRDRLLLRFEEIQTPVGAGAGAAAGAAVGGSDDLILDKGTRLELQLDRPLGW
jgi:hypothetical protein